MVETYNVPEFIFTDPNYNHFLIQYVDDIVNEYKDIKDLYITIINESYAILSYKTNIASGIENYENIVKKIEEAGKDPNLIIYFVGRELYILQDLNEPIVGNVTTVSEALGERILGLVGQDIIVGVIDTGIDYLSEEFINEDGTTRIRGIWDQTVSGKENVREVPYGRIYKREEINRAIKLKKEGGDPYSIVNSKDEYGHGTATAGIIGARGVNKELLGVAPKCEFVIVKLSESLAYKKALDIKIPLYDITSIFTALEFLYADYLYSKKPMVIILPLGTSYGSHEGNSLIDAYIKNILDNVGIAIVTGAGNDGLGGGHAFAIINSEQDIEEVNLIISPKERQLNFQMWVRLPSIMTISLISPSGQETGYIPIKINSKLKNKFTLDDSDTVIYNIIPDEFSGNQLINILINSIKSGTWKIRVKLLKGKSGRFDIWLPPTGIKDEDTKFIPFDSFGTITIPGDSNDVINVGAYNQNNKNILDYSGRGFRGENVNLINVVAPGNNILTVGPNNRKIVANGTGTSAAIVAGISALVFEWAITRKNYKRIYAPALITILERGTDKRKGDIYPNPQWGYGIIDLYKIFEELV